MDKLFHLVFKYSEGLDTGLSAEPMPLSRILALIHNEVVNGDAKALDQIIITPFKTVGHEGA